MMEFQKSCVFDQNQLIGQGAFSKVYKSNKLSDHSSQSTAVKVYKKNRESLQVISHAKRQQNILKNLESEFVCSYKKSLESNNNFYLIQKLQEGTTLDKLISDHKRLEPKLVLKISKAILKGLQYLYSKRIMHRDLKPSNIMYNSQNNKAVLLDLGFATYFHKNDEKVMTAIVGTPAYMSPEMLMGKKYNSLSDVWSFAVMVYEMLCGDVPFKGRNQKEILNAILMKNLGFKSSYSPTLEWIITNCLKIDTNERMTWQQLFLWMNTGTLRCKGNRKSINSMSDSRRKSNTFHTIHLQQEDDNKTCQCIIF